MSDRALLLAWVVGALVVWIVGGIVTADEEKDFTWWALTGLILPVAVPVAAFVLCAEAARRAGVALKELHSKRRRTLGDLRSNDEVKP